MKRRLFNFGPVLSLVLIVATAALWVRGHFAADAVGWAITSYSGRNWSRAHVGATLLPGGMMLYWNKAGGVEGVGEPVVLGPRNREHRFRYDRYDPGWPVFAGGSRWWDRLGFCGKWEEGLQPFRWSQVSVTIPLWIVLVTFGGVLCVLLRYRFNSRSAAGCCSICGYDLRATPDRCPECGMEVRTAGAQ